MIWLHYLIVGYTIPLLVGLCIFILKTKSDELDPVIKGTLVGILLPILMFNCAAMFHVQEMIWSF